MSYFTVQTQDESTRARTGVLKTDHGEVQTPVFMPVGTHATVKTSINSDLIGAGAQIILSNAYHLYLRPGIDLVQEMGGLHKWMNWERPILTDSGGYQIFSLDEKKMITPDGLEFCSHLDGSRHSVTPEGIADIQMRLGVDIMMPLDVCSPYPSEKASIKHDMSITHKWLKRAKDSWQSKDSYYPWKTNLFGIIQGGVYSDLRKESALYVNDLDLPGNAIGGLSVGEPQEEMTKALEQVVPILNSEKPRYLMGVGYPEDLVLAVERGIDMFDCVVPTRNGRNGTLFTSKGKLLIRNSEFAKDERPIDENCDCYTCKNHSRSYLRHLFVAREMTGLRLASLHNLTFFIQLLTKMRKAINEKRFAEFKKSFFNQLKV